MAHAPRRVLKRMIRVRCTTHAPRRVLKRMIRVRCTTHFGLHQLVRDLGLPTPEQLTQMLGQRALATNGHEFQLVEITSDHSPLSPVSERLRFTWEGEIALDWLEAVWAGEPYRFEIVGFGKADDFHPLDPVPPPYPTERALRALRAEGFAAWHRHHGGTMTELPDYAGAVRPGSVWEWEPLKPRSRETVTVTAVERRGDGNWWVKARVHRRGTDGPEYWNELGRWIEATVLVQSAEGFAAWHRPPVVEEQPTRLQRIGDWFMWHWRSVRYALWAVIHRQKGC